MIRIINLKWIFPINKVKEDKQEWMVNISLTPFGHRWNSFKISFSNKLTLKYDLKIECVKQWKFVRW